MTTTTEATTTTTAATTTTTAATTTTTTAVPQEPLKGDYNKDGEVTIADAVLLARFIAEDNALTEGLLDGITDENPDYDGDGIVTVLDIRALIKKSETE